MTELKSFAKEVQAIYVKKDNIKNVKIDCSDAIQEFARKIYPVQIDYRECFMAVYLNRANNTIGFTTIGLGGVAGTVADSKLVFQHGLLCNASSVLIIHNHPSGNTKPSESDINLTKKMVECGKFLDMPLLDHIILTEESYYSFANEGLI